MNIVDIIFLVLLVAAAVRGCINGFIVEVGGLLGMLATIVLAGRYCRPFGQWLGGHVSLGGWAVELAFVVLFIVGLLLTHALIKLLCRLVQPAFTGVNRVLGLLGGLLKGAVLCAVLSAVLGWILPGLMADSRLQPHLRPVFDWLWRLLADVSSGL